MRPPSASADNLPQSQRLSRAVWVVGGILFLVCVLRPVAFRGTWWELSRGRAVAAGNLGPSRSLLVADQHLETDWLGGVAGWLAYSTLGATGLMFLRIAAGVLVVMGVTSVWRRGETGRQVPIVGLLTLWLVLPAIDPSPACWDCLGALMLWLVAFHHTTGGKTPIRSFAIALVSTAAWAQFGPGFLIAPAVWFGGRIEGPGCDSNQHAGLTPRRLGWELLGTLLGGCLTPRGLWGWWDSARTLFPWIEVSDFRPFQSLDGAGPGTDIRNLIALVIVAAGVIGAISARSTQTSLSTTIASCLAVLGLVSEVRNLGWGVVWMAVQLGACVGWRVEQQTWWRTVQYGLLCAVACLTAIQGNHSSVVGWGLDSRLDPRMLQLVVENTEPHGHVWSDDLEAIGGWVWITSGRQRAIDAPHRALLGSRYGALRQLGRDLRESRQSWYELENGQSGGWWLPLEHHGVTLVLVNARDHVLTRALAPTIWQPLTLDSPVLVFARAGDGHYQDLLVKVVRQREFVEFGPWRYPGPSSTDSSFDRDRFGLMPFADRERVVLDQAHVFHSLGLPIAALRVLHWLREQGISRAADELHLAIQRDLARREAAAVGLVHPLRARLLPDVPRVLAESLPGVAADVPNLGSDEAVMTAASAAYAAGDVQEAARTADQGSSPLLLLVRGTLAWELGDPDAARLIWQRLPVSSEPPQAAALAQYWLKYLDNGLGLSSHPAFATSNSPEGTP